MFFCYPIISCHCSYHTIISAIFGTEKCELQQIMFPFPFLFWFFRVPIFLKYTFKQGCGVELESRFWLRIRV